MLQCLFLQEFLITCNDGKEQMICSISTGNSFYLAHFVYIENEKIVIDSDTFKMFIELMGTVIFSIVITLLFNHIDQYNICYNFASSTQNKYNSYRPNQESVTCTFLTSLYIT